MASTRNKNTSGNYALEIGGKQQQAEYKVYESYSVPQETVQPGNGLLVGKVGPAKLASNFCDIESQLRGIGLTNLVTPNPEVTPELNNLRSLNVFERASLIFPKAYEHSNVERPFIGLTE
jgi:hypothetical protein